MDSGAMELLDLVFRWVHVIAAIMWIGNSLLFNWLDRNLHPPREEKGGVQGEIWLLHSGGFYLVEKDLRGWDRARPLHWFKWQAYTTWITGASLLVVVYYAGGGALLVDPSAAEVGTGTAILIAVGTLAGVWLVYDLFMARLLAGSGWLGAPLGLALVGAVGWGLLQVLSGRAAFLHVGAMLGTVMAGNVFRMIMPSQRQLVASAERGERPDPALAGRAKERSIHNNYMTFPVVALMLSAHFPGLYGHRHAWLSLVVILVAGASVRHLLNIRSEFAGWRPALAGVATAAVALLYLLGRVPPAEAPAAAAASREVTFAEAHGVIDKRCTVCHSASPADRTFGPAPAGVSFDTPDQIRAFADRIRVRAVETRTMPPANKTWITPEEREVLRAWTEPTAGR